MFSERDSIKRSLNKLPKIILIIILLFTSVTINISLVKSVDPTPFTLVIKTNGGGVRPDYCSYIADDLAEIGIDITIVIEEWSVFVGTLVVTFDFDLAIFAITGGGATPDMRSIYTEDASLNVFGLDTTIPYCQESEDLQDLAAVTSDLSTRQDLYYQWQTLIMDKIVPILPLFSPRRYVSTWSNLIGYDMRWGIPHCLPYMEFSGFHSGQVSLTEFNIADSNWIDLNPLSSDDTSSKFLTDLATDPIISFSPDLVPLKTGLVEDWEQIDDYHYKFYMRDGVYWNPSYNVTARSASSAPLNPATTPLMLGLKAGISSNGANIQVTAKDAVFTYLTKGNSLVSDDPLSHQWISACYEDPVDNLAFHIEIDGDPDTPTIESYPDFWSYLPIPLLPEFFLNSSDPTITYTAGGVQCTGLYSGITSTPQWLTYSESVFGCGKYQLDYYVKNSVSVLAASPYWHGIGAIDGSIADLDIETINVRIIPDKLAQLAEFKAGKLDWIDITYDPTERKQMQADSNYDVQTAIIDSLTVMAFNLRRPNIGGSDNFEFIDESGKEEYTKACAVRKAICYAIDREDINANIHDSEYLIAHSVIYPYTAFYYYNDIIKYNRDLVLAIEWLNSTYAVISETFPGLFLAIVSFCIISLKLMRKTERRRIE